MSIKPFVALLASSLLALAHGAAHAHETVYQASLLGASETPAAATPGTGLATVTIDFDLLTMRVEANFSGLLGNVTAAHIHCCTASAFTGNAGVATMTPSFVGFPTGVKAGSHDQTFNMALSSSYSSAFITAKGGTVGSAFNALVAGLDSGTAYFNVHSSAFPGGEVRALLSPVPEPTTALLALGGLGLVAVARRRQRA